MRCSNGSYRAASSSSTTTSGRHLSRSEARGGPMVRSAAIPSLSASDRARYRDQAVMQRRRRVGNPIQPGVDVKIHEYQGKEIFRKYGIADAARHPGVLRRRGRERRETARRLGLGRQGADPRRRARQGRRRQGREIARRSEANARARSSACSSSPTRRARRPESAPPAGRGRRRHQEGALRRHGRRPRHAARGADGELRGRNGHRGSRRENAGEDPQGFHRPGDRPHRRRGR